MDGMLLFHHGDLDYSFIKPKYNVLLIIPYDFQLLYIFVTVITMFRFAPGRTHQGSDRFSFHLRGKQRGFIFITSTVAVQSIPICKWNTDNVGNIL